MQDSTFATWPGGVDATSQGPWFWCNPRLNGLGVRSNPLWGEYGTPDEAIPKSHLRSYSLLCDCRFSCSRAVWPNPMFGHTVGRSINRSSDRPGPPGHWHRG